MAYKKIKDAVIASGQDPNDMVGLQQAMMFEDYFADTIYPTIDQEGYTHILTGATLTGDRKTIDMLIMQFDTQTGYKMDILVYLDGERPSLVKEK